MIACLRRLRHRRRALGEQAGEENGALDLRAGNVGRVCNSVQRRPMDREWRVAVDCLDPRAHPFERRDHAPHRTTRQRGIARHRRRERMAGEKARDQPHRRPGIAGIERFDG